MTCWGNAKLLELRRFSFRERDTRSRFALACWVARPERGASITCRRCVTCHEAVKRALVGRWKDSDCD